VRPRITAPKRKREIIPTSTPKASLDWFYDRPVQRFLQIELQSLAERLHSATLEEAQDAEKRMTEILGWVLPPESQRFGSAEEKVSKAIAVLNGTGKPEEMIAELRRVLTAPTARRGRPVSKNRRIAIDALEKRLSRPGLSWPQVTNMLCQCGNPTHSENCKQNIRTHVRELQALLKKYDFDLPPRSEMIPQTSLRKR
jgi:hypothetical protein